MINLSKKSSTKTLLQAFKHSWRILKSVLRCCCLIGKTVIVVVESFHLSVLTISCKKLSSNTILPTDSSLIGFLWCLPHQHDVVCQQCQKPFVIHLFSVKYGGALLRWAYESRPPSYFLITGMHPTLPFHHMVISCSPLKWGVRMLICQPLRSQ